MNLKSFEVAAVGRKYGTGYLRSINNYNNINILLLTYFDEIENQSSAKRRLSDGKTQTKKSTKMTTHQLLNKNVRTMPSWVVSQYPVCQSISNCTNYPFQMEANDRIGPKPPPTPPNGVAGGLPKAPALPPKAKSTPEPDYEIIEFSSQQYSNEPMKTTVIRTKTPGGQPFYIFHLFKILPEIIITCR